MSKEAMHASAPGQHLCSDCNIDGEACPTCYGVWWRARHPHVHQYEPREPYVELRKALYSEYQQHASPDREFLITAGDELKGLALLVGLAKSAITYWGEGSPTCDRAKWEVFLAEMRKRPL